MDQSERRAKPDRRVKQRGGRRLADDPGWQEFTGAISMKVGWIITVYFADSIAEAARRSGVDQSQIQDAIRGRRDPSASVIYRLARAAGLMPYLLFESTPVTKRACI